jgi:molecular chaperone DnaK (HSP70)
MIKDAHTLEEVDLIVKAKVEARNEYENYLYHMTRSIEDKDKLADKIE